VTRPLSHGEKALRLLDRALEQVNLAVAAGEFGQMTGGSAAGDIQSAYETLEDVVDGREPPA
jgi:hypothetical protein